MNHINAYNKDSSLVNHNIDVSKIKYSFITIISNILRVIQLVWPNFGLTSEKVIQDPLTN